MTPVGVMIIFHPAVLCLGIGSAMLSAGIMYAGMRSFNCKRLRIGVALFTGIVFFILFSLYTTFSFDLPPFHIETIAGL